MTKSYKGLRPMTTFNPHQRETEARIRRAEAAARRAHGQMYMRVYDETFSIMWYYSPQNAEREAVAAATAAAIKAYNLVYDLMYDSLV